ncbi:MAG: hypothetical protein U9P00_09805 [Pseudomonadota bacterium]|nr:hypothetical protein [Pseudomonadota bacterium]
MIRNQSASRGFQEMGQHYITSVLWVFSLLLTPCSAFPDDNRPFSESVVIFNTICAKCHEAQCSGRLSFDKAYEASSGHIVRHYNEASGKKWLQKELFKILNHMKEKCSYYPMSIPVPPQRVWNSEILDKMTTLLERNYFIPVGPFSPGSYKLELNLARDEKVTLHLVSETFNILVEDCYLSSEKRIAIPFSVEDAETYYLRIYPRKPVQITQLAIHRVNPQ